jgi:hypothetical protein
VVVQNLEAPEKGANEHLVPEDLEALALARWKHDPLSDSLLDAGDFWCLGPCKEHPLACADLRRFPLACVCVHD